MATYTIPQGSDAVTALRVISAQLSELIGGVNFIVQELVDQRDVGRMSEHVIALAVGTPQNFELPDFVKSGVIINDGANPCQYRIPADGTWIDIRAGETASFNFTTPRVKYIGFQIAANTTTLRLITAR